MYDWANSAYSTLSIVVVNGYLLNVVFPEQPWGKTGRVAFAWAISCSMLLAGCASPVVGAWADARAAKRRWLAATALLGSACAILMGLTPVEQPWLIVALFAATSFFFELSLGFYNAFLPELAGEEAMNRVSAWGFALGYIGGGIALAIGLAILAFGESIGLAAMPERLRAGILLMGAWWGMFSLPALFLLRDRAPPRVLAPTLLGTARHSFDEVWRTLRNVRALPSLALFLLGFLFYNDGVQTVISQASVFADKELNFKLSELGGLILMIQFVSFPGALLVGWVSDRLGQRPALFGCLAVWVLLLVAAYFIHEKWQFWCLGAVVALVLGGVQSVSRAIMGRLTPPDRAAEFFGFFNLSGKTTSFMGTFLFGLVVGWTDSPRLAIVSLLAFILLGFAIVARVDFTRGRQEALAAVRKPPA